MHVSHSLLVGAIPLSSETSPVVDMSGARMQTLVYLQTTTSKCKGSACVGLNSQCCLQPQVPPSTCCQPWLPSTIHQTSLVRLFTRATAPTCSHEDEDASQCHRPQRPQPGTAPLTRALMGVGSSLPRRKDTSAAPTKANWGRCQGAFLIPCYESDSSPVHAHANPDHGAHASLVRCTIGPGRQVWLKVQWEAYVSKAAPFLTQPPRHTLGYCSASATHVPCLWHNQGTKAFRQARAGAGMHGTSM